MNNGGKQYLCSARSFKRKPIILQQLGKLPSILCWVAVLFFHEANATMVFPIATNSNLVEFSGPIFFDGTNYMAGLKSGPACACSVLLQTVPCSARW
jgi:hypothetical protein